ncbi:hypothetical protein BGP_4012 [Beggiatoa sp. PS]|nr:hypothetical protein BGP_4012 [Beggiatoa sp. PS]
MRKRVRLYVYSLRLYNATKSIADATFTGLWLSLLQRSDLVDISTIYYTSNNEYGDNDYTSCDYNRSGLFDWEDHIIREFFPLPPSSLVVVGAGGGREVLALMQKGYSVIGWECVRELVTVARCTLAAEGFPETVYHANPDQCPSCKENFAGGIVGWGTYMLIRGKEHRIGLLMQLAAQMSAGAPLLLSFYLRDETEKRFKFATTIAGFVHFFTGGELPELGDYLATDFVHFFTRNELQLELAIAGFDLIYFSENPYGHAVARLRTIDKTE